MPAVQQWGRKGSIVWPSRHYLYTLGALFFSLVLTGFLVYVGFQYGLSPLERHCLPYHLRSDMAVLTHPPSTYPLLYVSDGKLQARVALEADLEPGLTPQFIGKHLNESCLPLQRWRRIEGFPQFVRTVSRIRARPLASSDRRPASTDRGWNLRPSATLPPEDSWSSLGERQAPARGPSLLAAACPRRQRRPPTRKFRPRQELVPLWSRRAPWCRMGRDPAMSLSGRRSGKHGRRPESPCDRRLNRDTSTGCARIRRS